MTYDYYKTNTQPQQWDNSSFLLFQTVIQKLDELDKRLGQKDCHDPKKAEWTKEIEKRLEQVEQAQLARKA